MAGLSLTKILGVDLSSVDDSLEIGGLGAWIPCSAMKVGFSPENPEELIYLGEIPIDVVFDKRFLTCQDGRKYSFWRHEVKADSEDSLIQKGDHIVISEYPYRTEWVQHALFKTVSKKGPNDRRKPTSSASESKDTIIEWINNLSYDFWAKDKYLTAGVITPEFPLNFIEVKRNIQSDKIHCYGVCENYETLVTDILLSKKSKNILELTRKGIYKFWPSHLKLKGGQELCLNKKVIDRAEAWLDLSIRQALAGPHNVEQSRYWMGKPVINFANIIYAKHLNRDNIEATKTHNAEKLDESSKTETQEFDGFDPKVNERIACKYNISVNSAVHLVSIFAESDDMETTINRMGNILAGSNDPDKYFQEIMSTRNKIKKRLVVYFSNPMLDETIKHIKEAIDACEFDEATEILDQLDSGRLPED